MKEHIFFTLALLLCVLLTLTTQVYADIIYQPFPVFKIHTDGVLSIAFLDNQRFASGGDDGVLRVSFIRSTDGDLLWEKNLGFPIHTLAALGDDRSILAHNNNEALWIDQWPPAGISIRSSDNGIWWGDIRTANGDCLSAFRALAFNPLNDLLVSVGPYLCIWNVEPEILALGLFNSEYETEEEITPYYSDEHPLLVGTAQYDPLALGDEQSLSLTAVAWSPDGRHLAIGVRHTYTDRTDSTIKIFNVEITDTDYGDISRISLNLVSSLSGAEEGAFRLGDPVNSLAWSPDGTTLVAGFGPNSPAPIKVWNVENLNNPELTHTLPFQGDLLAWSPDGEYLAIGGRASYHYLNNSRVPGKAFLWSPGDQNWNLLPYDDQNWNFLPFEDYHAVPIVLSWAWSPDGTTLTGGCSDGTIRLWRPGSELFDCNDDGIINQLDFTENCVLDQGYDHDVNDDGVINIQDLVLVAASFGPAVGNGTDINRDGVVNIRDLILIAGALGTDATAPSAAHSSLHGTPTSTEVEQWLTQAQQLPLTDATSLRGVLFLQQFLSALTPKETALLANYPNPFNPETWIPYQLANPAEVTLRIYTIDGSLVRTLALGHKEVGLYQTRTRAAYWDGKNEFGEPVASGVYFYTLSTESTRDSVTAGDFTATRKMLIRK